MGGLSPSFASSSDELALIKHIAPGVLSWIVPLTECRIRCFRHAATLAAVSFGAGLVQIRARLQDDIQVMDMSQRVSDVKRAEEADRKLKALVDEIQTKVCSARWKDVFVDIRRDVVMGLISWMRLIPSEYLKPSAYSRYLGWGLYDSVGDTRLAVFDFLCECAEDQNLREGILSPTPDTPSFLSSFAERIIGAVEDVDLRVAVKAVRLLTLVGDEECVSDSRVNFMVDLLFTCNQPELQRQLALFVDASVFGASITLPKNPPAAKMVLDVKAVLEFMSEFVCNYSRLAFRFVEAFWELAPVFRRVPLFVRMLLVGDSLESDYTLPRHHRVFLLDIATTCLRLQREQASEEFSMAAEFARQKKAAKDPMGQYIQSIQFAFQSKSSASDSNLENYGEPTNVLAVLQALPELFTMSLAHDSELEAACYLCLEVCRHTPVIVASSAQTDECLSLPYVSKIISSVNNLCARAVPTKHLDVLCCALGELSKGIEDVELFSTVREQLEQVLDTFTGSIMQEFSQTIELCNTGGDTLEMALRKLDLLVPALASVSKAGIRNVFEGNWAVLDDLADIVRARQSFMSTYKGEEMPLSAPNAGLVISAVECLVTAHLQLWCDIEDAYGRILSTLQAHDVLSDCPKQVDGLDELPTGKRQRVDEGGAPFKRRRAVVAGEDPMSLDFALTLAEDSYGKLPILFELRDVIVEELAALLGVEVDKAVQFKLAMALVSLGVQESASYVVLQVLHPDSLLSQLIPRNGNFVVSSIGSKLDVHFSKWTECPFSLGDSPSKTLVGYFDSLFKAINKLDSSEVSQLLADVGVVTTRDSAAPVLLAPGRVDGLSWINHKKGEAGHSPTRMSPLRLCWMASRLLEALEQTAAPGFWTPPLMSWLLKMLSNEQAPLAQAAQAIAARVCDCVKFTDEGAESLRWTVLEAGLPRLYLKDSRAAVAASACLHRFTGPHFWRQHGERSRVMLTKLCLAAVSNPQLGAGFLDTCLLTVIFSAVGRHRTYAADKILAVELEATLVRLVLQQMERTYAEADWETGYTVVKQVLELVARKGLSQVREGHYV